jgi:hypothetical protein
MTAMKTRMALDGTETAITITTTATILRAGEETISLLARTTLQAEVEITARILDQDGATTTVISNSSLETIPGLDGATITRLLVEVDTTIHGAAATVTKILMIRAITMMHGEEITRMIPEMTVARPGAVEGIPRTVIRTVDWAGKTMTTRTTTRTLDRVGTPMTTPTTIRILDRAGETPTRMTTTTREAILGVITRTAITTSPTTTLETLAETTILRLQLGRMVNPTTTAETTPQVQRGRTTNPTTLEVAAAETTITVAEGIVGACQLIQLLGEI